jgi:transcriptional regulator with XRE-family HTH domain
MNQIDRNAEIKRLWEKEGLTLEDIGSRFGLTRERARQILRSMGAAKSPAIREKRRVAKATKEKEDARSLLVEALAVLTALYDQGATKQHAVDLLVALYPAYDVITAQNAVELSKLRFQQAAVTPRFSDEFVKAAVHWIIARQTKLVASHEDAGRHIGHALLIEITEHFESGLVPAGSLATILREIAGTRVALANGIELSLSHSNYEDIRLGVWAKEGWAGGGESYWPPSKQTVMKRLGNGYWVDAMNEIGLKPSDRKGRSRGLIFYAEADYESAIKDFYGDCQQQSVGPTHVRYDSWAKEEKTAGRPRPSGVGQRNYFGSWTKAVQFAQQNS